MEEAIVEAWQAMSYWELAAVSSALVYVILAAREHIACWPAAVISSGIYIYILLDANLYLETGLQGFYLIMAFVGWYAWTHVRYQEKSQADGIGTPIRSMTRQEHGLALGLGIFFTLAAGTIFGQTTDAALPFLDAFTTGFALYTTYLVTQKKLENWLYWVVIDILSIYLYASRGLYLSALLFILYTIIALVGYFNWRKLYRQQLQEA